MSETIDELPFVSPFVVCDFNSMFDLYIIGEDALKPANASLQIESFSISFVTIHHSLINIAVLKDDNRPTRAFFIKKLPNVYFMRTQSQYFQVWFEAFNLLHENFIERTIST
jgi:hypothetical protein